MGYWQLNSEGGLALGWSAPVMISGGLQQPPVIIGLDANSLILGRTCRADRSYVCVALLQNAPGRSRAGPIKYDEVRWLRLDVRAMQRQASEFANGSVAAVPPFEGSFPFE